MRTTLIILIVIFLIGIMAAFLSFLIKSGAPQFTQSVPVGGILFSGDGGLNWAILKNFRGYGVREFAMGTASAHLLYAGTFKNGLWIGDEKGEIWRQLPPEYRSGVQIYDIAEDPLEADALYVAVFQKNRGRLLHYNITENSARELYFTPLERYGIFGVRLDPSNPRIIWLVSSDGGFYESSDRGKTWRVVKRFGEGLLDLVGDKKQAGHLWIITSRGRIFETFNAGRSWSDISEGLRNFSGSEDVRELFFDDKSRILYLASAHGLLRSLNGGKSWEELPLLIPPEILPIAAVAVNPQNSRQIYAASENQLYKSDDGGFSWQGSTLPTKYAVSRIVVDPGDTKMIYIGLED